jgi:glycosyltransferase involved in cell wall biosynthesis
MDLMLRFFVRLKERNPDAILRIVGAYDPNLIDSQLAMAGLKRGDVELIGRTPNVAEHYVDSDLFVMTSEVEGQPMVLLEAATHELPQLVFEIGGLEDQVVDGKTGYLVPFGEIDLLAERADTLLRAPDLRRTMGAAARKHVHAHFNPADIGNRWNSLLNAVASGTLGPLRHRARSPKDLQLNQIVAEFGRWVSRLTTGPEVIHVSVIVPVYGTEPYLQRCLTTLTDQTLKEIEIIVVDDCSPGNAAAIVEEHARRDPRIRYIRHDENLGLYQARSTGSKIARGTYLAHVDSDDYVDPHMMASLFGAALTHGADIVECQGAEIEEDGTRTRVTRLAPGIYGQAEIRRLFAEGTIRHVVWNKLYKRSFWEETPFHNQIERRITITEDLLRNVYLVNNCSKYVFIDKSLYRYIRRTNSVTRGTTLESILRKLDDIIFVYENVAEAMRYFGIWDEYRDLMGRRRAEDIEWYICRFYQLEWPEEEKHLFREKIEGRFGVFASAAMYFLDDKIATAGRELPRVKTEALQTIQTLREVEARRWDELATLAAWHRRLGEAARKLHTGEYD